MNDAWPFLTSDKLMVIRVWKGKAPCNLPSLDYGVEGLTGVVVGVQLCQGLRLTSTLVSPGECSGKHVNFLLYLLLHFLPEGSLQRQCNKRNKLSKENQIVAQTDGVAFPVYGLT